jgi:hypothetical protein
VNEPGHILARILSRNQGMYIGESLQLLVARGVHEATGKQIFIWKKIIILPLSFPHHAMANKSNKKPKATTRGRPPIHKKAKISAPIVEPAKICPQPRRRPPPERLSEADTDLPGNNSDGQRGSPHGDEVYAASVALLGLARGDGSKSGSIIAENDNEMEIVVDGGHAQEDGEDEDPELSSEDENHEGVSSLCLKFRCSTDFCCHEFSI